MKGSGKVYEYIRSNIVDDAEVAVVHKPEKNKWEAQPAPEPQPEEQPNQTQAAFRQRSLYQNTKLKNVLGEVPNILQSGFSFHQKSNSLQDALESTPNIFQQRLRRRY